LRKNKNQKTKNKKEKPKNPKPKNQKEKRKKNQKQILPPVESAVAGRLYETTVSTGGSCLLACRTGTGIQPPFQTSVHGYFCVDGVYSYQTSYGFASGQITRRSQGTLLLSSGEPKVSNPWNNVQRKDSI
jgi:hypothetical protein